MPLLAFEGGYGGMVHTDGGRVSLSCCIRHRKLVELRKHSNTSSAGEAVLAHIVASCRGVREALDGATLDGAWLASGPMRPGRRTSPDHRLFLLGNAAGEAHPVIAEGISMALHSAWLASQALMPLRGQLHDDALVTSAAAAYRKSWSKAFSTRIAAAALFAYLAERPASATVLLPLLQTYPRLLTWGARWSGKTICVMPKTASAC
jgi:flavin-dependent dehydrogenase